MNRRLVVSTALSTLAVFSFAGVPDLPWSSSAVTLSGGYTQTLTQAPGEATAITLRNADLHLAQGVSLDSASTVEVVTRGWLHLVGSQTLASLSGTGFGGGIEIPSGCVLTVNEALSSITYGGNLRGEGGFAKGGAGELWLTRPCDLSGKVAVSGGTLGLLGRPVRPELPENATSFFAFDSKDNYGKDTIGSMTLTFNSGYDGRTMSEIRDAPSGHGLNFSLFTAGDGRQSGEPMKSSTLPAGLFSGNSPFTVSVWIRVPSSALSSRQTPQGGMYLFLRGNWTDHQLVWFYVNSNGRLTCSFQGESLTTADSAADDRWHHVALSYSGSTQESSIYVDGALSVSKTLTSPLNLPSTGTFQVNYGVPSSASNAAIWAFEGDMDDYQVASSCWTAEQVKAEYERLALASGSSVQVPEPVAKWTFDDNEGSMSVGATVKDESGNGYDLVLKDNDYQWPQSIYTYESNRTWWRAVDMCSLYWSNGSSKYLEPVWTCGFTAETFPAKVPTGNAAFSVSVRLSAARPYKNGGMAVSWGTPNKKGQQFSLGFIGNAKLSVNVTDVRRGGSGADISSPDLMTGDNVSTYEPADLTQKYETLPQVVVADNRWVHAVVTYDPTVSLLCLYEDGALSASKTLSGPLDLAAEEFSIGGSLHQSKDGVDGGEIIAGNRFTGLLDDVQIFDFALSADQVVQLTRSLATGADAEILPKASEIEIANGARLLLRGDESVLTNAVVSGTGALDLGQFGSVTLGGGSFSGQLLGGAVLKATGALAFSGDASQWYGRIDPSGAAISFSGEETPSKVSIVEDAVFEISADRSEEAPSVSTPGTVLLPICATVKLSAAWNEANRKKYLLIDADALEGSFDGWTFEGVPEGCRAGLCRNGGKLYAQFGSNGLVLIFR